MDKILITIGKIKHLLSYIAHDMLEPAGYLPLGLIAGILFLIIVYAAVLLKLAFFSREPGSRTTVDLILFNT